MSAQLLPLPVPLNEESSAQLERLVQGLEPSGLWWLSGYAAGLAQARGGSSAPRTASVAPVPAAAPAPAAQEAARLTVVYGSQTGNARRVAEQLAREAEASGLAVRLLRADAYPQRELANERLLTLVVSTQGEGDPSDDARGLVEFLASRRAPRLPELRYAVLGLGDSSYPQFCAVGRQLDARLAELGATRLIAAGEADLDIETVATPWRAQALGAAREWFKAEVASTEPAPAKVTPLRTAASPAAQAPHSRERPFAAEVLSQQRITARSSGKDVRHLELSLAGSGLRYTPGDALGVWPRNPPALVDAMLDRLQLDADTPVTREAEALPLREWLTSRRELTRLSRPWLAAHAERARSEELSSLLTAQNSAGLAALFAAHQPLDVLQRWPATWDAEALVAALRPLAPRLYSIASSQAAVGEEAHLTVDVLGYEAFGATHVGAASSFLAALDEGAAVPVYIEPNERFRLPADSSRDVIMIGPGTGVAPFRGFLQERVSAGARGRHWLFFGNPHFRSDFLYQLEWQAALKSGALQRLSLAFSRDGLALVDPLTGTPRRTYVQQRLREHGRDLHAWLDGGAHLYVCGATAMGKDVHLALRDVVATERRIDAEAAEEWLSGLQQQGRYARDVY